MASSEQRAEPGLKVLPPVIEEEEPVAKGDTCTKKNCEEDAADNSVLCEKHRDQKRRANEKQGLVKPKKTAAPKPDRRVAMIPVALPQQQVTETWDEWKIRLIAELEDAEKKLRAKLDTVVSAQGAIRAL